MKRQAIDERLHEICDEVHSSCDDECPVYRINGDKVPNDTGSRYGCDCFKNGKAMKEFIEKKEKETGKEIEI